MQGLPYPLSSWAIVDESFSILSGHENWKMYNGLEFDEEFMKNIAEQKARHAELFLSASRRPRRLFVKCVSDVSESKKTPLSLELDKARAEKVVSRTNRFHGRPVNWKNWRQFSAVADADSRRRVYDELIKKTPVIRPLIRAMFEESWSVHRKYGTTPLRSYLESERITLADLKILVQKLGAAVKKPFREALEDYAIKIKKAPSAVAFFVQIPNDARVLVKPISPYTDMEASYHEFGHAMHCISVDANLPLWDRESLSHGVAEIFSTFLESLVEDPRYLWKKFGLSEEQIREVTERRRFMELFFVAFYAANSLMKISFQEKKLTMDQASELYAKMYKEYVGLEIPGEYWQLHHVMPDYDLYSPSYLIAAVRKSELIKRLQSRLGEEWWDSPKAGDYLRKIMRPGANIDLDEFSRLDTGPFLKPILHP